MITICLKNPVPTTGSLMADDLPYKAFDLLYAPGQYRSDGAIRSVNDREKYIYVRNRNISWPFTGC